MTTYASHILFCGLYDGEEIATFMLAQKAILPFLLTFLITHTKQRRANIFV
jgi:hypothetical protein